MKNYEELTNEVKEQVKSVCRAYSEAHVEYYNGEYHVEAGVSLRAIYPDDFEVIGDYKAVDIFTEDERTINYVNAFHSYPVWYKGKRDYSLMRKMDEEKEIDMNAKTITSWVAGLVDGNIELVEKKTERF